MPRRRTRGRLSPWRAPPEHSTTTLRAPVTYACHAHPFAPGRNPNGPLERQNSQLRRARRRGALLRRFAPPPRAPKPPSRPISDEWPRLDPEDLRSKPLDPDPAAHVRGYRFGLNFLLKRPPVLLKSTRSPNFCKNNYAEVLILTRSPLSFTRFNPAVQPWFFYELDPGVNVYLRLGPRF